MKFPFYEQAEKELIGSCNLCASRNLGLHRLTDRYRLEAPTVKCQECGLVQLSHRMTSKAYREFYEGGHYRVLVSEFVSRPVTAATIESDQRRYAEALAGWLRPHMSHALDGLLLDLGGSTGIVADALAHYFNLDATVVEPALQEAQRAHAKGLAVAPVPLEEYAAGGNHYDLVTLCRSVEHLLDIKAALAKIRQWVKKDGLFFVDFVDFDRVGQTKIDHPFYLTRKTMTDYLCGAGFEVIAMEKAPRDWRHVNVLCRVP